MKLLVTGGAGYIGSIVASQLIDGGHEVVVLDSLFRGHRAAVPEGARFVQADLREGAAVAQALAEGFDGVLHFGALALVSESVDKPEMYREYNEGGTRNLLAAMREADVPRLVFSSTCAVYGEPEVESIGEDTPTAPVNPYGESKLAADRLISDAASSHGLAAVSLRYFNVAGARGALGEDHHPETHLVPLVLQAASGARPDVKVFGTDYPTPDGTAIRDYVHVEDLGDAHVLALDRARGGEHAILNLGSGTGYSVREVIEAAREVTGREIPAVDTDRRAGDPPRLVASNAKVRSELGWAPERDLARMISDAWRWHGEHPAGYAG